MNIGEVKGVTWQAADQDMTKVEEDQSSPCLFISGEKIEVWPSASIALDYLLLLQKARMPLCSMYSSASRHFTEKEWESVQLLEKVVCFKKLVPNKIISAHFICRNTVSLSGSK